jgi:hypothetical protein
MKKKIILILMLTALISKSQECSPYHIIPKYQYSDNKSFGLGYVACLHARGVVAEVGYDKVFLGLLAMGEGHHGAAYSFLQYEFSIRKLRIYGGPAYRLNHNPGFMLGRVGVDLQLIKHLYCSASILQINSNLNYLHVGLKINY